MLSYTVALGESIYGGCFPPSSTAFTLVANGIQTLYVAPRALFRNGYIYVGWVNTVGSVGVTKYKLADSTSTSSTLSLAFEADAHNNPALLFLADGRLAASWSGHNDSVGQHVRVSTSAEDISAWGSEIVVATLPACSYSDQLKVGSRYYLHYRGGDYSQRVRMTTDFATWDTERQWVAFGVQRPYVKSITDGVSRVDLFFSAGHPDEVTPNALYHAYLIIDPTTGAESFFKSNGTSITGPATPSNATLVYDGTAGQGWTTDLMMGSDGKPRVTYTKYVAAGTDHRHMHARWTGSVWISSQIAAVGGSLYSAQLYSDGQCVFDGNTTLRVYVPNRSDGVRCELQEYRSADNGATWGKYRDITTGLTTEDAFTPTSIPGHPASCAVIWNQGVIDGFVGGSYNAALRGIGQ